MSCLFFPQLIFTLMAESFSLNGLFLNEHCFKLSYYSWLEPNRKGLDSFWGGVLQDHFPVVVGIARPNATSSCSAVGRPSPSLPT